MEKSLLMASRNKCAEDYNKAMEEFNQGKFQYAQLHLRPCLEKLWKIIIFDLMESEQDANDFISGTTFLEYDKTRNKYLIQSGRGISQEGASLADLARKVIFYRRPQLLDNEKHMKRLKNQIEAVFNALKGFYGTASELAQHDESSSDLDLDTQTVGIMNFMPKFFDDLKDVLSNETYEFLSQLEKPSQQITRSNDGAIYKEEQNNDFVLLDQITNNFDRTSGVQYVALLPETLTDKYGHLLSQMQLQDFFRLQWGLVVDLNPKTIDGIFESAPSSKRSTLRIITDNHSEVTGSSEMINWLFAKGRKDLEVFDRKKTNRITPGLFKQTFSKIVVTGKTDDYIIFDFCSGDSKYTIKLLDELGDIFGSWESVEKRCRIVSFSNDGKYCDDLDNWATDYDLSCLTFVRAGFLDFIQHLVDTMPAETSNKTTHLLVMGKTLDLTEARSRYTAAGIEFFGPSPTDKKNRQWDFYSGAEITWEELDQQYDVQRDIYPTVRQRIVDIIKSSRKVDIFTVRHMPGSGATTLVRRLAYDIRREDASGNLSCTVVEIKNCSNIRLTEQYLGQLSEQVSNTCILAIVEAKRVGREKFDRMVKKMSDMGKRILFLYVETFTGKTFGQKNNVVYLDDKLKPNELNRFITKYTQLGLNSSKVREASKNGRYLEVIDFPLMFRDNETSANLSSYVMEWMDTLPENLKKFCAYVGFVSKYSDSGVNQNLLKSIWRDANHPLLSLYPTDTYKSLKKLLIEEYTQEGYPTGIWRPRYGRFSVFILNAYKNNWESGLTDLAKSFIALCSDAGQLGDDDKDMLYNIFIIRKNADYRALEERQDIRNKFSLLIKDLDDMERSESLFKSLVDAFPDNAVFQGHFARFLYEKATSIKDIDVNDRLFADAQERLDVAFRLIPDDADLHHMQGMLIRRRISALQKTFVRELNKNHDDINISEYEYTLEDWVEQASMAFERSIGYNSSSPYGYAAECQLYKEAIIFGQKLLQTKTYDFCDTNPTYVEYTEKLGETLDKFENICYTFKDEGLSQIMSSYPIYENVRLFHENVVGNDCKAISRYRSKYNSATGENKMMYASLLVKSIVYSKIRKVSNKDSRIAFTYLGNDERREIEKVLDYQKNKGDVKSYETMFLLKLYGTEEYSLDEAIDFLKDWESQYTEGNQYSWGYLSACFYLAVCYASKAIIGDVRNTELSSLARDYFAKSEDIAKKFGWGTIHSHCYFGGKSDIHCIVDKNNIKDAIPVSGVITRIHNNKGNIEMKCGMNASFNPRGYDILRDEGTALTGILGFSYSGPGLYEFGKSSSQDAKRLKSLDGDKEITFEELSKEYLPSENLVDDPPKKDNISDVATTSAKSNEIFRTESEKKKINVEIKGKIDVEDKGIKENADRSQANKNDYSNQARLIGIHSGIYLSKSKKVKDDAYPNFSYAIASLKDNDLYDEADVEFELWRKPIIRKDGSQGQFYYAENVRFR